MDHNLVQVGRQHDLWGCRFIKNGLGSWHMGNVGVMSGLSHFAGIEGGSSELADIAGS